MTDTNVFRFSQRRRRLVRHGHLPEREIMIGIGPVAVRCPRVRDRVGEGRERIRFLAALCAPIEEPGGADPDPLPQGHLHRRFRGGAPRAARQRRRRAVGRDHFSAQGGLVGRARALEQARSCGQTLCLLLGRRHPRAGPPRGRGAVPSEEVWLQTRGQRCWVHKTANVLNKLPKSQQPKAKRALQEIWMAETKKDALAAFDAFVETWGVKYDKAVACLIKDRDALLAFYDFPAEHWKHLRTTNVIESSFATVRHRTVRSKGCLSNKTALAMIFKLADAAEKSWRRLDGHNQLPKVILGVKFADGIEVVRSQAQAAAA
jgi:Transposase, Mutator family